MTYRLYMLLHLTGVVVFLGGFLAALFLAITASRIGNRSIRAYAFTVINYNDKWFTPLAVLLIVGGGFGASSAAGLPVVGTGWILWSLGLFILSGLIFVLRALPLQREIESLLGGIESAEDVDWSDYDGLVSTWKMWAIAAFLLVTTAFVLMVLKPALPAAGNAARLTQTSSSTQQHPLRLGSVPTITRS